MQLPCPCVAELFQRHGRGLSVLEKFTSKMSLCDPEVRIPIETRASNVCASLLNLDATLQTIPGRSRRSRKESVRMRSLSALSTNPRGSSGRSVWRELVVYKMVQNMIFVCTFLQEYLEKCSVIVADSCSTSAFTHEIKCARGSSLFLKRQYSKGRHVRDYY